MTEAEILRMLDLTLQDANIRSIVEAAIERIEQALYRKPTDLFGWEVIGLDSFSRALPDDVGSAWVFVIRAGIPSEKHRHPNSRQRTIAYRGTGDLQVLQNGIWFSNVLKEEATDGRCLSIPAGAWHRPVVERDWVVVSFHTIRQEDLTEESGAEALRTRVYSR
jgi:quercetin dioxygenase-like cupin family protein